MFWSKEPEPPKQDYSGIIIIVLIFMLLAKYGKKSLQFQIFKPTNKLHEVVGLETVKKEIEYFSLYEGIYSFCRSTKHITRKSIFLVHSNINGWNLL